MNTNDKEALQRMTNSMKMWIRNHWAESITEDSKWYYLFPTEDGNPVAGVFCIQDHTCYQGAARFYDNGGLESFPDKGDWHAMKKSDAVAAWKVLVDSGKYYHYNPLDRDPKVD